MSETITEIYGDPIPEKRHPFRRIGKTVVRVLAPFGRTQYALFLPPTIGALPPLSEHDQLAAARNSLNGAARHLNEISEKRGSDARFYEFLQRVAEQEGE